MAPYTLILLVTLIISPFAISLAQKQDQKNKSRLKYTFLLLLVAQILLGLFSWKVLLLFLLISLLQITLLVKKTLTEVTVVILNFLNTFLFFFLMIRGQGQANWPISLPNIAITFILLFGNVISLLLINKNKKLKPVTFSRRGRLIFIAALVLIITTIIGLSFWNNNSQKSALATVSTLPEVQEYLYRVPTGQVTLDSEDKQTNSYLIHVYEIKDGHTATFNWYTVDKATLTVTKDF